MVPVFNEEKNVVRLLERLDSTLKEQKIKYEIVFIDDRSTDKTYGIIKSLIHRYPISLYSKKGLKGKAYSLLEGFSYTKYECLVMIDADLQYPPEAIPQMLEKMEEGYDIVVADRSKRHTNLLRKIVSKSFSYPFGRVLHGLRCDVQSGLKLFRKEIVERVDLHPGPWSFDLEFLVKARDAGYKIGTVDIVFDKRLRELSKINIIPASLEMAYSAIKLWFKPEAVPFHRRYEKEKGKGFHYKGLEFIHHSSLSIRETAFQTLFLHQKALLFSAIILFAAGLILNWYFTILSLIVISTLLYFLDLLFNLFLILRNFSRVPEIHVTNEDLDKLKDKDLPRYTILCPLYREWQVLPQFIKAISSLDYPKTKLQVMILLEEDDKETLRHAQNIKMPDYFESVVVPHSLPKTKPKALNYGLQKATGEYIVVYDAEDIPDTKQLKKAIIAFRKTGSKTACIQAKLNFYNPGQNILTRVFTAEYSLWFDLVLTGLQSIGAPIPLGGTSNHFNTNTLRELKGWDSFNVTEDCDLGIRLSKRGYNTALIHSLTLEEANSDLNNWFEQRTRWIKGYMQTYLVHMRKPREFRQSWKDPHFIIFQLVVGGKVLSMVINPFMWIITILYFALRSTFGVFISQFYPAPVLYLAVFSLVFGNFLYMYYYMIGCAKRGHYELIRYVLLVPFYWLAMSVSAWKAMVQLVRRPHFWPKTIHGFHLDRKKALLQSHDNIGSKLAYEGVMLKLETVIKKHPYRFSLIDSMRKMKSRLIALKKKLDIDDTWNFKTMSSGSFLMLSSLITSGLNLVFNAFFGRVLTFRDFGLLTLINTFLYVYAIFTTGLSGTVNHRVAFLSSREGAKEGKAFFNSLIRKVFYVSSALTLFWIASIPFLVRFFHIQDVLSVVLFTPVITLGLLEAVASGYLTGTFSFTVKGLITVIPAAAKIAAALLLVILGLNAYAYIPIIAVSILSFVITFGSVSANIEKNVVVKDSVQKFPTKFFLFNTLISLSSTLFLTIDILLVNHYLSPIEAGMYAFLSLSGKMVYYFGSMMNTFIYPFVARAEGLKQNTKKTFLRLMAGGTILSLGMYLVIGVLGRFTMPFIFGSKTYAILPFLNRYALAIAFFTVSGIILHYEAAKKHISVSLISLLTTGILAGGIVLYHDSLLSIVNVVLFVSALRLIGLALAHIYAVELEFVIRNLRDFADAFVFKSKIKDEKIGKKAILIFNWRDTKHSYAGGAEVYVHELAKRWVIAGHKVTLFCGNDGHCPRYEVIDGVEIVRRGGFYFVYVWAILYYLLKFRGKYDVIIDCENGIPFFTPLYAVEKKYLLIHHVHQEVFLKSLRPPFSWIATFMETKLMPLVYSGIQLITVSPSSKKEILEYKLTNKEPHIIFNGVDLAKFKPGKKHENPIVLYLGRLKYYKSLHIFIKSAYEVLKEIPHAEFIIAGDGEEKEGLLRLTDKLGLKDKIKFLGRVTEEQKIDLYKRAWVLVNPSFMEGWGITSIEANACGTPVIAADVPGLRDSVRNPHTGFLVKHGDINGFTQSVITMITDKKLRSTMSRNALAWAQNFGWEKSAVKSLEILL